MNARVEHRGRGADGLPCRHLLFRLVDRKLELECACGGIVFFSPQDLRALAEQLESETRPAWELVIAR